VPDTATLTSRRPAFGVGPLVPAGSSRASAGEVLGKRARGLHGCRFGTPGQIRKFLERISGLDVCLQW
jgi:hypothetical protein